ncbi:MAG: ABC transporter permease, partial [Gorillibacterium sp.]|nr:ABC transporter permease [Gorillibacterium sp.]
MVIKRKNKQVITLLWVFFCMNVVWFLTYRLLNNRILPGPIAVYASLGELGREGIGLHIGYSLLRIFAGVVFALIFGLLIGMIMGRSPLWN